MFARVRPSLPAPDAARVFPVWTIAVAAACLSVLNVCRAAPRSAPTSPKLPAQVRVAPAPRALAADEPQASDFFVAPDGSPNGGGSQAHPWDLQTALSQPPAVRAGDTIWLRGGRYVGTFRSALTGTPAAPIKVRQYPGERATLDGNAATTLAAAMDAATTVCPLAANLYGPN